MDSGCYINPDINLRRKFNKPLCLTTHQDSSLQTITVTVTVAIQQYPTRYLQGVKSVHCLVLLRPTVDLSAIPGWLHCVHPPIRCSRCKCRIRRQIRGMYPELHTHYKIAADSPGQHVKDRVSSLYRHWMRLRLTLAHDTAGNYK